MHPTIKSVWIIIIVIIKKHNQKKQTAYLEVRGKARIFAVFNGIPNKHFKECMELASRKMKKVQGTSRKDWKSRKTSKTKTQTWKRKTKGEKTNQTSNTKSRFRPGCQFWNPPIRVLEVFFFWTHLSHNGFHQFWVYLNLHGYGSKYREAEVANTANMTFSSLLLTFFAGVWQSFFPCLPPSLFLGWKGATEICRAVVVGR